MRPRAPSPRGASFLGGPRVSGAAAGHYDCRVLAGAHVSTSGGIHTAIDRAEALGADAVQIFTQSPRAWRPTNHDPANFERFKERRAEAGIGPVVCHAVYLINLAAPDDTVYEKSKAALLNTVEVACAIEADGVVLHVGSHLGAGLETGLERALPPLREALERCSDVTWILLENSAGAGGTIGRSIDELAVLVDRLDAHPRLGVCLDSCHLWVSGVDVTDAAALDATIGDVDERIGLDRLRCLHVNDAAAALGSNRDRHANLGEGELGEGLGAFLAHGRLQGLPAILEVPGPDGHGPDADEVRKLRQLHGRWARKRARSRARRGTRRAPRSRS
jgi:deoxyribonuclease-4